MKVNYFSYYIKDNATGLSAFENICSIINNFCQFQDKNELAKDHKLKKLYLATTSIHSDVFYLMTPAVLGGLKAVNRLQGVIKDIVSLLGTDSLEKVAYLYIDPELPIIGFASGRGCADIDDLSFFIDEVLNTRKAKKKYTIKFKPIKSKISKGDAKKFKLITEAKVRIESNKAVSILSGLLSKEPSENMAVEVTIKRTDKKENIKEFIAPLLKSLSDKNDKNYAEVYLRAKADEFQSNVKEYILDSNGVIFDFLNPTLKSSMEEQLIEKRYKNQGVVDAANKIMASYSGRIPKSFDDEGWNKMKEIEFHKKR